MLIRRKEGHCPLLSPTLELPLTELALLLWPLLAGAVFLWLPAGSAGLSDPENMDYFQHQFLLVDCPLLQHPVSVGHHHHLLDLGAEHGVSVL